MPKSENPPDPTPLAQRTAESARLITADRIQVWEDEFRVMHLRLDGRQYDDVRPARAFPISGKADYVGFLDDKGKEVALLDNPKDLDAESLEVISRVLQKHYFVPKITQIYRISETWGITHWHVLTDCGHARFEVIDREKIRKLPGNGLIIVDADENRYEVPDVTQLDDRSQLLIQSET